MNPLFNGAMMQQLKQRLESLRLVASLGQFLKHPGELDSVFAIARRLQGSPLATQMQRHLLENPAMAALVAEGWRPAPVDLDQLLTLPAESLGHAYAQHLRGQGLTAESLIDPTPITSPEQYLTHRLRETHDIVHVLTGFGVDGPGELGLQAFNLAQVRSPLAVMLIFGGLLKVLQEDEPLEPLLRALSTGFSMGLAAHLVVAAKLEEGWERPVSAWRQELELPAAGA